MNAEPQLLLVEDNDVDVEAIQRAFRRRNVPNALHVARDGVEALRMLRAPGTVPRPHLVLLDLNLPRMNGHELLAELRANPALHDTVVFVLTTSSADEDKRASYRANVAGYIVKRDVGPTFSDVVDLLSTYWRVVDLPAERRAG